MQSAVASVRRLVASPSSVVVDKLRSRFWSLAEQRLSNGSVPLAPIASVWHPPAVSAIGESERARCLESANQIIEGVVPIFGKNMPFEGTAPNWLQDPASKLTWPFVHHSRIDVLDLSRPSDARIVWEINRCQYLIPVAQAYVLSEQDRYADACLAQMDNWIERNPPELGINWTSSMEVGIRSVVWSWLLEVVGSAEALTDARRARIVTSLMAHGRHIARHLEHEEHSGNHYLANALGLIVLGSVFRNSGVGQGWLCRGQQIMNTEIPRQFYADGVNYEGSVAYHGLALEMALLAEVALRSSGQSLCAVSLDRLDRALDVTLAVSRSDGSYPPIGDVDDGHILPLGPQRPRSHSHLLALGGALFKRPDLALAGRSAQADLLWLLGEDKSLDDLPGSSRYSRAFPQGGVYVLQDDAHHLTIDCGNVGSLGRGGHGHADALSFDCFALGQPLIVDAGTFSYSGDPAARQRYRSIAQHNTLAVDDRETPRRVDLWSFEPSSDPRLLYWETTSDTDVFGGSYELSGLGVTHERWIVFDRRQGRWLVDDRILGSGMHHLVLRFHVPSINVDIQDGGAQVHYPGEVGLIVQRIEGDWARPRVDACKISLMYRQEVNASAIVLEGSAQLMARCLTALVPYEGQCPDRDSILEWARSRELPYGADHPRIDTDRGSAQRLSSAAKSASSL